MNNNNSTIYGIIIAILLLLSAGIGWFFWQKSKNVIAEKEKVELEWQALQVEKQKLEQSLDSLSLSYSDLRTENENLQGKVTSTAALVEQKDQAILLIKKQSARNAEELRSQVAELQKAKTEYETIVNVLRQENAALKEENQQLKGQNEQLTTQVADLGKQLEEQIRKTQSALFKATSFRAELQRRNDKLTTKARRARELVVSFDLADVPEQFQGSQKLYLVITDDKGNPVTSVNPTNATVYAPSGPVNIIAQQVKLVQLETTQRLLFNYTFDERLKAGVYVVAIYCDKGLLGAHHVKLT